jgi:proline dehydrogenase
MIVGAIKADIDSRKGQAMGAIPSVAVLFGTHNWNSCKLILDALVESGLASKRSNSEEGGLVVLGDEVTDRLVIGQLYG